MVASEVIDLLSSSPPKLTTTTTTANTAAGSRTQRAVFEFDIDDFDVTGDLEFAIAQSAKRRKLDSPVAPLAETTRSRLGKDVVFELSSEPDDFSFLLPTRATKDDVIAQDIEVHDIDDHHGISFSSSAPELSRRKPEIEPESERLVLDLSSDGEDSVHDPIQMSSQPIAETRPAFSERTANLLANVRNTSAKSSTNRAAPKLKRGVRATSLDSNGSGRFQKAAKAIVDDIFSSSQPEHSKKKASKGSKSTKEEKNAKVNEKEIEKAAKIAEKELEKQKKLLEKEEKKQQKQKAADIAEVNKSKTNKKNSTPEMVVDLPTSLKGKSLANQVEEYMRQSDVELTYVNDEEFDLTNDVEVYHGAILRWRRKVTAEYDEDNELWKPLSRPRISKEDHILVYLKAEELVTLAVVGDSPHIEDTTKISESTMKSNLDIHVATLKSRYPNSRLVYLIEGLTAWNKRTQNAKNKAYTAAVRAQPAPQDSTPTTTTTSSSSRSKRRKPTTPAIDLSHITASQTETLLLHLQLNHQPLQIHHTTSPSTSATQILSFTQHLSTRPYRLAQQSANLSSASFCMTTGQIRTGSNAAETWVQMLQEINRVTPSMAYGIAAAGYKNPMDLVRGFRTEGREMLEDVRKSVNKDGGWSDRRLGPMVSKRVYKVFMGRDPSARDGIA